MDPRRYQVFFWVGPPIAMSWLTLAFFDPDPGRSIFETIGVGYFFGSLFAHTTLAAAWSALGSAPLLWRMPLSLIWVALLAVAVGINVEINGGPKTGAIMVGAGLLAQWLLLQFLLWGLKLGFGLHLRHVDESQRTFDPQEWQFGIRQLIVVTTIVGVVFGIGRLLVASMAEEFSLLQGEGPIILFLATAAIVLSLPLLLAGLMERRSLVGILVTLVLIGVGTAVEGPLLAELQRGPGPKLRDLIAINCFTAAFILVIVMLVRRCGFSLARLESRRSESKH